MSETINIRGEIKTLAVNGNKMFPIDKRRNIHTYVSQLRTEQGLDFKVETVTNEDNTKEVSITRLK